MNLYKLHSTPESLDFLAIANQCCPEVFFDYSSRDELAEREAAIARSARHSYKYALILKGRFLAGEAAIAADGNKSCSYAMYVLGERFLEGEPAIVALAKENPYSWAPADYFRQWPEARPSKTS